MSREIRALTALRGVAALWVVLHHAQPAFWPDAPGLVGQVARLGYAGVDLFFVLSGFVLTTVYGNLGPAGAARFWGRRVFRVYPLHLAVMAAIVLSQLIHTVRHGASQDWGTLPANLLMMQPFFHAGTGWNAVTWSVGVELVAYALFPLLIPLLRRLRRAEVVVLVLWLGVVEVVVLRHYAGSIVGLGALLRGLAGFGLGALLARLGPQPASRAVVLEMVGAGCIAAAVPLASPPLVGLGAAALILGLAAETGPLARALARAPVVWLGAVSFSIYLVHPLLLGLMLHPSQIGIRGHLALSPLASIALLLGLLLPIAAASHHLVEQPGRRLGRRLERFWVDWHWPGVATVHGRAQHTGD